MIPTSEPAKRIARMMHRKLTTHWNEKERRVFRKLVKDGHFDILDDLAMMERYYARNWPPDRNRNCLRHDLYTLIFNWPGELDRATAWTEKYPLKPPPRKIIPMPAAKTEPYAAPTDPQEVALIQRFEEEFRQHKQRNRIL